MLVVLLAAGVIAAWKVNAFWRERSAGFKPASSRPAPQAGEPAAGLELDFPAGAAGVSPLEGDPGGIAPPLGAQRRGGFSRRTGRAAVEVASYDYAGTVEAAADHYRTALAEKGFRRLGEDNPEDALILTFKADDASATVSLRKAGKKYKIVIVELAITRESR